MPRPQETERSRYAEKLLSWQWREYRRAVLRILGEVCNRCGVTGKNSVLQIHHRIYRPGLEPWQYKDPEDIEVLCRHCHKREHGITTPDKPYNPTMVHVSNYYPDWLYDR